MYLTALRIQDVIRSPLFKQPTNLCEKHFFPSCSIKYLLTKSTKAMKLLIPCTSSVDIYIYIYIWKFELYNRRFFPLGL